MKTKFLSKDIILRAMRHTKSNMAAARFVGCSYPHYKKFAETYIDEETSKTLLEVHMNRAGKGISKHLYKKKDITPIMDILEGRINIANYSPKIIKERLIHESLIEEECACCKFNERRVVDYKIPLLLSFKDKNKQNWKLENLELLCYNCYFLTVGNIWSDNQLAQMEDYTTENRFKNDPTPDWELDDEHIQHLKSLGLWEDNVSDGTEFISNNT
tara:strand:- start:78 stop:722 length:645 start_codon:yes stop_codon:yes gene_type:complete